MDKDLENRITKLEKQMADLGSFTTIPFNIDGAFRERLGLAVLNRFPEALQNAPLTAITAPTGGMTTDSEARTAINSIITALETVGILIEN